MEWELYSQLQYIILNVYTFDFYDRSIHVYFLATLFRYGTLPGSKIDSTSKRNLNSDKRYGWYNYKLFFKVVYCYYFWAYSTIAKYY